MKHLSFRPLCQRRPLLRLALPAIVALALVACQPKPAAVSDSNTPLHLLQPQYDTPYGVPSQESVRAVVDRVTAFVEQSTPVALDDSDHVHQGAFRLTSYEWGVTYGAMLSASRAIGSESYARYAVSRMAFLADCYPHFRELYEAGTLADGQMRQVVHPQALDDAGAVCTAMIKAQMADSTLALRPLIDNYMDYILHQEYRLPDGTFARMRPLADAVWLDDMFMAIPAIVWYGRLTDSDSIVSEAVRQVTAKGEVPVRAGGDEFYSIGAGHYTEQEAQLRAEQLEQLITRQNSPDPGYRVGVSVGWCMRMWCEEQTLESILHDADIAMYRAKSAKKYKTLR